MATRATVEKDELAPYPAGSGKRYIRALYVSDDESGAQTIIVRPYSGSVEIRSNGQSVTIDTYAVDHLIRALRAAAKES